ncbi:MAG TPA: hypothetical protein VGR77_09680 [Candidatus Dormibacteraeota bacterium]|nr:hypothetical protein [Candidatus Dormibacteraeota bacterium]
MNRKLFGALLVAGGLALSTSVTGLAQDYTPQSAKDAISACALTLKLTSLTTLTGAVATDATLINLETTVGLGEITSEANRNIDELASGHADEDGTKDARAVNAQLSAIVTGACQAITKLQAEYAAAIAELKAESTQPEQQVVQKQPAKPDVEKPDVEKPETEKPETEKPDSERNQPAQHSSDKGND